MYIKIYVFNIYRYIRKISTNENNIFLQKDAHRFTDHFASPKMSVRFDFEGVVYVVYVVHNLPNIDAKICAKTDVEKVTKRFRNRFDNERQIVNKSIKQFTRTRNDVFTKMMFSNENHTLGGLEGSRFFYKSYNNRCETEV